MIQRAQAPSRSERRTRPRRSRKSAKDSSCASSAARSAAHASPVVSATTLSGPGGQQHPGLLEGLPHRRADHRLCLGRAHPQPLAPALQRRPGPPHGTVVARVDPAARVGVRAAREGHRGAPPQHVDAEPRAAGLVAQEHDRGGPPGVAGVSSPLARALMRAGHSGGYH
ncbi:hypothetical protein ACFQVA_18605 [Actinomadura keratinilytica]